MPFIITRRFSVNFGFIARNLQPQNEAERQAKDRHIDGTEPRAFVSYGVFGGMTLGFYMNRAMATEWANREEAAAALAKTSEIFGTEVKAEIEEVEAFGIGEGEAGC